jgi:hypothetical protein
MFQKHRDGIRALLGWIVGNLLGLAATSALIVALPILKSVPGTVAAPVALPMVRTAVRIVLGNLIAFGPIGLAQWLILRRLGPLSMVWLLTIPFGTLAVPTMSQALQLIGDDEAVATLSLGFAIWGAAIGLLQWLVLRRQYEKAAIWIASSSAGMGLGLGLVLATGLINRSEFVGYVAIVLIYGVATGLALSWLLNHKIQTQGQRFSAG